MLSDEASLPRVKWTKTTPSNLLLPISYLSCLCRYFSVCASGYRMASSSNKSPSDRWGTAEEVDVGFRERSLDRSPFRERHMKCLLFPDRSTRQPSAHSDSTSRTRGPWKERRTASLELGPKENTALPREGISPDGCSLERCTNQFGAARRNLSCEDR